MTAALSLIFLTTVGAGFDTLVRDNVRYRVFRETERVATQWSARVRDAEVPTVLPSSGEVVLIQLADSRGHVLRSSEAAAGRPALTANRPPADDRFQEVTQCPPGGPCVMLTAVRVTPTSNSSYVYAGLTQPPILAGHWLEVGIVTGALLILCLVTWMAWSLAYQILGPVECIRVRMSEITGSDLSLRVPQPPGRNEIAMLARTANLTLNRLEAAVRQQRRFASDASHELRTPLAGLRSRLEEALLYPQEVDPHDAIRGALSTADRLEAIINDLLMLARLQATDSPPPECVDLRALVTEVTAARSGRVPVHVHALPEVRVRGSRIQLMRVVENLLANAQRHADTRVDVTVVPQGRQAVVTVADDGDGIPPQDRERVFARFTRLDSARRRDPGGSGLGLAISREIAEAHAGTLEVEDSPRGACFVLRLPTSNDARQELVS
ncbi:sensor histidine kinase [Sphaerisporangium perillae]|uniref:sensor histidine kinase n=1 Tax=Sphaerisporangium perillae TaxID=2935860 RepID=UPI00200CE16A|nr:HAMP domain-containing sensor histidine kinase [Sphaerisporangium perillae]